MGGICDAAPVAVRPVLRWGIAFVAWLPLASIGLPAVAQTARAEYGIKEEDPHTGGLIRRAAICCSRIPINRRYEELTDAEKAILNENYEKVDPGDEPPFPSDGLKPIYEALYRAQMKLLTEGELKLVVSVGPDGQATTVKALGSPSPEMTRFASSVMLLTRFKPARCHGQPCAMQFPFTFNFVVNAGAIIRPAPVMAQ
jgi:hypothetical protein